MEENTHQLSSQYLLDPCEYTCSFIQHLQNEAMQHTLIVN